MYCIYVLYVMYVMYGMQVRKENTYVFGFGRVGAGVGCVVAAIQFRMPGLVQKGISEDRGTPCIPQNTSNPSAGAP